MEGIKIVGADIVEVATPYDTNAQITAIAAADIMYEGKFFIAFSYIYSKWQSVSKQFLFLHSHESNGQEAIERSRISQF